MQSKCFQAPCETLESFYLPVPAEKTMDEYVMVALGDDPKDRLMGAEEIGRD